MRAEARLRRERRLIILFRWDGGRMNDNKWIGGEGK